MWFLVEKCFKDIFLWLGKQKIHVKARVNLQQRIRDRTDMTEKTITTSRLHCNTEVSSTHASITLATYTSVTSRLAFRMTVVVSLLVTTFKFKHCQTNYATHIRVNTWTDWSNVCLHNNTHRLNDGWIHGQWRGFIMKEWADANFLSSLSWMTEGRKWGSPRRLKHCLLPLVVLLWKSSRS